MLRCECWLNGVSGCGWSLMSPLSLLMLQPGDNKLAHSAQMYHYQHQKQQMLSLEKWVTPWAQTRSSLPAHMRPSPAPHPTLPCVPCLICVNLWIFYDCDLCRHRDEPKVPDSGASTDEENDDGDFTVYECPGLAPVSRLCFFFFFLRTLSAFSHFVPSTSM